MLLVSIAALSLVACKGTPPTAAPDTPQTIAPPYSGDEADARPADAGPADAGTTADAAPAVIRTRVEGCPDDVVDCCPYVSTEECTRVPGCHHSYAVVFDDKKNCWPSNATIYGCEGMPTEPRGAPQATSTGKDEAGRCVQINRGFLPAGVTAEPCGEGAPTCPRQ